MDARRQSGLNVNPAETGNTFMKFLVEDLELPEVDVEYERLYGSDEKEE